MDSFTHLSMMVNRLASRIVTWSDPQEWGPQWSVPMVPEKLRLLERIDRDRELLIHFLQEFIRCPSANPPGDTRTAARHVPKLLDTHGIVCRVIAPDEIMPN
jgi:hypothetical protein